MCASFVLDWSQISKCAVDGRVQQEKYFTFLSFSCPLKAEQKKESTQQRGRNMFRPRPNNKELHTSHSFAFTGHYSQQPDVSSSTYMYCSLHCVHIWEAFSLTAFLWLSVGPLKVTNWGQGVYLEREAELPWKQPCQSQTCFAWFSCWTALSRPSVSTCVTHTQTQTQATPSPSPGRSYAALWFANECFVSTLVSLTMDTFLYFPIDLTDSCSAKCPWLGGCSHFF